MKNYSGGQLVKDIVAGIIVAIIALPLSIALALASGVEPATGVYTAIAAGFKPICIWSPNAERKMTKEQEAARRYILEHEEVPPQYDLLIFNDSLATSINLYGELNFIRHFLQYSNITAFYQTVSINTSYFICYRFNICLISINYKGNLSII